MARCRRAGRRATRNAAKVELRPTCPRRAAPRRCPPRPEHQPVEPPLARLAALAQLAPGPPRRMPGLTGRRREEVARRQRRRQLLERRAAQPLRSRAHLAERGEERLVVRRGISLVDGFTTATSQPTQPMIADDAGSRATHSVPEPPLPTSAVYQPMPSSCAPKATAAPPSAPPRSPSTPPRTNHQRRRLGQRRLIGLLEDGRRRAHGPPRAARRFAPTAAKRARSKCGARAQQPAREQRRGSNIRCVYRL